MIRPIVIYGEPGDSVLRRKSKRVEQFTQSVRDLLDDLHDTLNHHGGLGLAANQIGVARQVVVVAVPDENGGTEERLELINPRILSSHETWTPHEGCLSFPNLLAQTRRPRRIRVRAQNVEGKSFTITAADLFAQIILHEVDHLNGILLIDRLAYPGAFWPVDPTEN